MSEINVNTICPDCNGTGIVIESEMVCCQMPDNPFECCNCPVQKPYQVQCDKCQATGIFDINQS